MQPFATCFFRAGFFQQAQAAQPVNQRAVDAIDLRKFHAQAQQRFPARSVARGRSNYALHGIDLRGLCAHRDYAAEKNKHEKKFRLHVQRFFL